MARHNPNDKGIHMNLSTNNMSFSSRSNFALRIVGGAAAAALAGESSVAGWTISNAALVALAIALVTIAFEQLLGPNLPARYGRMTRFAFSAGLAVMAVATVVAAFRSTAMPS